jgi:hypothetical protein
MIAWVVVVIAWGFGLAWVADAAASRGRSQIGWVAVAVMISIACLLVAVVLPVSAVEGSRDIAAPLVAMFAPLVVMVFSLFGLGMWLKRQPVKVRTARVWPVSCRINGSGKLELLPDAVRLVWQDRTQDIPRVQLSRVQPDGECLRLAWDDGELVLMPMLHPQTRDGRIEQSQRLAGLLSQAPPVAIQVKRTHP